MSDDEDLQDIITRQRLTIYHQQMRIEGLQRQLLQATQMNPNDIITQAFNQLQTSNELAALKIQVEDLHKRISVLQARGGNLAQMLMDIDDACNTDAISKACIRNGIEKWKEVVNG